MNIAIDIYLKAKMFPQEIHYSDCMIVANNIGDAVRFLNRMIANLPKENTYIICVNMNFDDRKTTVHCYNIREYLYFTMGFEKLATILGYMTLN